MCKLSRLCILLSPFFDIKRRGKNYRPTSAVIYFAGARINNEMKSSKYKLQQLAWSRQEFQLQN